MRHRYCEGGKTAILRHHKERFVVVRGHGGWCKLGEKEKQAAELKYSDAVAIEEKMLLDGRIGRTVGIVLVAKLH